MSYPDQAEIDAERARLASAPVHHQDNDVLTADELRVALRLSERQFSRVAPKLPVSYALGNQSPRYVYGEVVNYLRKTGAAA